MRIFRISASKGASWFCNGRYGKMACLMECLDSSGKGADMDVSRKTGWTAMGTRGLVLAVLVLLGMAACAPAVPPRPPTGVVYGNLDTCIAIPGPGTPQYSPGTVSAYPAAAYRGSPTAGGTVYSLSPRERSASMQVTPEHGFSFTLPPGQYVLTGRYRSQAHGMSILHVTVRAGARLHADIPDECI